MTRYYTDELTHFVLVTTCANHTYCVAGFATLNAALIWAEVIRPKTLRAYISVIDAKGFELCSYDNRDDPHKEFE
jgi:hypothetical protein